MTDFDKSMREGRGKPYADTLLSIAVERGLPARLLARIAYQESRFRDDIITGKTISEAGAVGMFQIIPKWHPDAKPLDWLDSAKYAANYLNALYKQFGDWGYAVAAYNWGQGNLKKYGISKAPKETRDYYTQILADVPNTGSVLA